MSTEKSNVLHKIHKVLVQLEWKVEVGNAKTHYAHNKGSL